MENLYTKFNQRKEYINSFKLDHITGDYTVYFLDQFISNIIDYYIERLHVGDILDIEKASDIKLSFKVIMPTMAYCAKPNMSIDEDDNTIMFYLPTDTYSILKSKILSFFTSFGHTKVVNNPYNSELECLEVNTNMADLITTYGKSLPYWVNTKNKYAQRFRKLVKQKTKPETAISALSSILADELHAKHFEEEFLDRHVIRVIKEHIDLITTRNIETKKRSNFPVSAEIAINYLRTIDPVIMTNIEEIETPFIDAIVSFMKDYNLGRVVNYSDHFAVRFDTSIDDLIDAYYMEKQRIAHFTSGDYLVEEQAPTARRLSKK